MTYTILESAAKRFAEDDIRRVLTYPVGKQDDFPRVNVAAVAGFTPDAIPLVVLVDTRRNCAFHAQRPERKYQHLIPPVIGAHKRTPGPRSQDLS